MIEEPVLLETAAGPISGVCTLPDGRATAAAMVLAGARGSRSSINQVWTRVAWGLADAGIATLRCDYPGCGESWDADPAEAVRSDAEIAAWFRTRTRDAKLLAIASCYGVWPAVELIRDYDDVAGAVVLNPPLWRGRGPRTTEPHPASTSRRHNRFVALPRRVAYRLRYGPAGTRPGFKGVDRSRPRNLLAELVSRTPTRIVVGEADPERTAAETALAELRPHGSVELRVIEGLAIRGVPTRAAQAATIDEVLAWAQQVVDPTRFSV